MQASSCPVGVHVGLVELIDEDAFIDKDKSLWKWVNEIISERPIGEILSKKLIGEFRDFRDFLRFQREISIFVLIHDFHETE